MNSCSRSFDTICLTWFFDPGTLIPKGLPWLWASSSKMQKREGMKVSGKGNWHNGRTKPKPLGRHHPYNLLTHSPQHERSRALKGALIGASQIGAELGNYDRPGAIGPRNCSQNDDRGGLIRVGRLHFELHNLKLQNPLMLFAPDLRLPLKFNHTYLFPKDFSCAQYASSRLSHAHLKSFPKFYGVILSKKFWICRCLLPDLVRAFTMGAEIVT